MVTLHRLRTASCQQKTFRLPQRSFFISKNPWKKRGFQEELLKSEIIISFSLVVLYEIMKRRNVELAKMRRPMKRNKITEGFYGRYICDNILSENVNCFNFWAYKEVTVWPNLTICVTKWLLLTGRRDLLAPIFKNVSGVYRFFFSNWYPVGINPSNLQKKIKRLCLNCQNKSYFCPVI